MRNVILLAAVALALAGCQSVPQNYIQFHAGTDAATVAKHLADKIGACWFDGKNKAFEGYSYSPEPNFSSSRILIVPKGKPHDLPALIVEVLKAKRGTDVRLFGPLMQSESANSIRTDVMRWTGGARDCG
jgi:hypothetical protein